MPPPKPMPPPVRFNAIPRELQQLAQWVVWDYVWDAGKRTWDKPPKRADNGDPASVTDPGTWGSFDQARGAYELRSHSGVGFVFASTDPFCGIDLDDCRDPISGAIEQWAVDIIRRMQSYAEVSPSGTGVKIVCRAKLRSGRRFDAFGVEIYDRARYFTITGQAVTL